MTPNLAAFLAVIRACEGTSGPDGYRTLFGGGLFEGYADHPRIVVKASGYTSSAAGAYQILTRTWDDFIAANGPHDFSPASQDLCARWLIGRRGASADVEAGRLRAAITKCNREWASLPGSPYGQPTRDVAYCERMYHMNGGSQVDATDTQPAAPIEDKSTPLPAPQPEKRMGAIAIPLLTSLIPQVLSLFSTRAQATIAEKTGADPKLAEQFMQGLIAKVGDTVGIDVTDDKSATQAVGKLTADVAPGSAQAKALEDHSLDYLHKLNESLQMLVDVRKAEVGIETESANAAAARTDAADVRKAIDRKVWWAYAVAGGILAVIAIAELVVNKIIDGQIVGALILAFGALGGAIITMVNYGFGSSGSSGAKDVLIGEMARRQSNGGTQ